LKKNVRKSRRLNVPLVLYADREVAIQQKIPNFRYCRANKLGVTCRKNRRVYWGAEEEEAKNEPDTARVGKRQKVYKKWLP
jgi:hypothetical protein